MSRIRWLSLLNLDMQPMITIQGKTQRLKIDNSTIKLSYLKNPPAHPQIIGLRVGGSNRKIAHEFSRHSSTGVEVCQLLYQKKELQCQSKRSWWSAKSQRWRRSCQIQSQWRSWVILTMHRHLIHLRHSQSNCPRLPLLWKIWAKLWLKRMTMHAFLSNQSQSHH